MAEPTPFPTSATVNAASAPAQIRTASSPGKGDGETGRAHETSSTARAGLDGARAAVKDKAQAAAASADKMFEDLLSKVREKPLTAIGVAFAMGALIARVSR